MCGAFSLLNKNAPRDAHSHEAEICRCSDRARRESSAGGTLCSLQGMFSEVPSYLEEKKCFEVGMNEIYGMQENNIDKGKLKIQITSEATSFPVEDDARSGSPIPGCRIRRLRLSPQILPDKRRRWSCRPLR